MTTDMENELRDLFREKAGEAPIATPAAAPRRVLRRGRRRQVGTVLGSAALVLVLIVGSVAGLNALMRGEEDPFTVGNDYEIFQRTATIEAFTVGSPSDWFLVNQWPLSLQTVVGSGSASKECTVGVEPPVCTGSEETTVGSLPRGLPMFQLSNTDMGLNANACQSGVPDNGAVLYVALDYERSIAGIADPSIPAFPPGVGLPPEGNGSCGPGRYAHFTVNGEPFFSWIGIGSGVSDADRETVETSYEMMSAIPDWEPVAPDHTTPAYVIAGGATDSGETWRLEVRPGETNVNLTLTGGDLNPSAGSFTVPSVPIEWTGTDPIFGAITKTASGVEFRPGTESVNYDLGGSPVPGTIVPVPESLGSFEFDLFFIDPPAGYGELGGHVIALGVEQSPTAEPPSIAEPPAEDVLLSGNLLGHEWGVRFTGAIADESACIRLAIGNAQQPSLCPEQPGKVFASDSPSLHDWLTDDLFLKAGSMPVDVTEIRFRSDDGTFVPSQFRCQMGPLGWPDRTVCAIALPPEGSGTLEYLDADGNILFEEGNGWGSAQAVSNELPWTNENKTITARGSYLGAEWKLEVLYFLDGYRLTIDGRHVFEGVLMLGEPAVFPLFEGGRASFDAIVLVVTGTQVGSVSIASEGIWEGRWIPGSTANGAEARVWVIEVPGAGTGSLRLDDVDRGISWP